MAFKNEKDKEERSIGERPKLPYGLQQKVDDLSASQTIEERTPSLDSPIKF
jgi:hypothetical protein